MRSLSGLLRKAQRERARTLGTPVDDGQQAKTRATDAMTRQEILADDCTRTRLARERAARSQLLWRACVRWAILGALVVVFLAAVTALAVAWSHDQTAAAMTAAGAITVQLIGGVLAAVRKGMFDSTQEKEPDAAENHEEEPPSAQLTLVLNEG
jgi:hypothetical protein